MVQTDDDTTIFVSSENRRLNALIAKAQRRNVDAVDNVRDFYLEHIAFHALLTELNNQASTVEDSSDEESGVNELGTEKAQQKELQRACETVCGIMDQMFDLITTQAPSA